MLLADSTLVSDASAIDYSLSGVWTKHHLSFHPQTIGLNEDFVGDYLCKKSNLVAFDGKLLAIWDEIRVVDSLSFRLPVDYLLVFEEQKPDLQSVVNSYDTKLLIVDGSMPRYLAEKWISQANELHLPYHDIGKGAYEKKFMSK